MARPPIVDDLYTRRLETRDIERSNAKACEVREQAAGAPVLRTRAERCESAAWHPDADDWSTLLPRAGADGTLRVDVVSDGVVRVR